VEGLHRVTGIKADGLNQYGPDVFPYYLSLIGKDLNSIQGTYSILCGGAEEDHKTLNSPPFAIGPTKIPPCPTPAEFSSP
jgi:hypothetical protein